MRYPQELIQKVREAHKIETLFEEITGARLQRSGSTYKTLCPFHDERTPSCIVNPATGTYKCYGCHAYGDAITLIMEKTGVSFVEAVQNLAESATPPIPLPTDDNTVSVVSNRKLKEITAAAWKHYRNLYKELSEDHPAREQIANRNLNPNNPYYGYAPGGNSLTNHLKEHYTAQELTLAGVCGQNSETGELYDFWRNRLMFPITDMQGNPVSFTGRALDPEETRKYVNGKATPIFQKEKLLYNPDIITANQRTRETKKAIIVEGQFDVIALYEHGYYNTYATSGTAITKQHINTLTRLTSDSGTITYLLDGDKAGQKALTAAYHVAPEHQTQSWATTLPNNQDPCDYLKENTTEQFAQYIHNNIKPLTIAALNAQANINNPTNPATQHLFLQEAATIYNNTPTPANKKLIINHVAALTQTTTYQAEKALTQTTTKPTRTEPKHAPKYTELQDLDLETLTPQQQEEYTVTQALISQGDRELRAAKKLLHLSIYYGTSNLLIQPETWSLLPATVAKLYNECVGLNRAGKQYHPGNFTNPAVASLIIEPTEADSTPLTLEEATREFNITARALKRAHQKRTRTRT